MTQETIKTTTTTDTIADVKKTSNLTSMWNTWKGKILVSLLTLIFGFGTVVGLTGVEVVDGPDGAVCVKPVTTAIVETPIVE